MNKNITILAILLTISSLSYQTNIRMLQKPISEVTSPSAALPKEVAKIYEDWKHKFNKVYDSAEEEQKRLAIFLKNLDEINRFNLEDHGWKKGLN